MTEGTRLVTVRQWPARERLIASELAANLVLHAASAGGHFTVRCQACPGHVRIEVEDLGGPWQPGQPDSRPHGLAIMAALTGPDGRGADTTSQGHRVVWARLDQPLGRDDS